jgi:nucleoside-diphosphate-sugar epimerase
MPTSPCSTLIFGGTGFLGGLVAAALLSEERRRLLLPVRAPGDPAACLARIRLGLGDRAVAEHLIEELMRLVTVVALPPIERLSDLDQFAAAMGVNEIIHCAGCVNYFDEAGLESANVDLTAKLLEAARSWGVERFIYLSTAYCSGYRSERIPERLHPEPAPGDEPTAYTRTKRVAEWLIADSGIPFVIIRPSIVIGDSRSGTYRGKNYGLYQLWRAVEGLLCHEYAPIWYCVAPQVPANLVHQDSFQSGFIGIYRSVPPDAIVHLVSDHEKSPTMRELCWMWADVYCPREVHCYARYEDVPLRSLPARHRRFLQVVAKNLEIPNHRWEFEATQVGRLRAAGLPFTDTTLETVARCQRRYIAGSKRIQAHMERHAGRPGGPPRLVEIERGNGRCQSKSA